jgi:hypothetical protein
MSPPVDHSSGSYPPLLASESSPLPCRFLDLHSPRTGSIRRASGPHQRALGFQLVSTPHTHTQCKHFHLDYPIDLPSRPTMPLTVTHYRTESYGRGDPNGNCAPSIFSPLFPIHFLPRSYFAPVISHLESTRRRRRPTYPDGLHK